MKITDVKLLTLELPEEVPAREFNLVRVPNLRRIQYTHKRTGRTQKERTHFLKVTTDEGIDSIVTTDTRIGPFRAGAGLTQSGCGRVRLRTRGAVAEAAQRYTLGVPAARLVRRLR